MGFRCLNSFPRLLSTIFELKKVRVCNIFTFIRENLDFFFVFFREADIRPMLRADVYGHERDVFPHFFQPLSLCGANRANIGECAYDQDWNLAFFIITF